MVPNTSSLKQLQKADKKELFFFFLTISHSLEGISTFIIIYHYFDYLSAYYYYYYFVYLLVDYVLIWDTAEFPVLRAF